MKKRGGRNATWNFFYHQPELPLVIVKLSNLVITLRMAMLSKVH